MLSRPIIKLLFSIFIIIIFSQSAFSQPFDLTGAWKDDNGITYCVRQIGNRLFWKMDDRPRVHNVFYGIMANENITGEWADLPGGQMVGNGTLALKIESNNRFVKVSQTSNYLGSVWTRSRDSECSKVETPQIKTGNNNLTGTWIMRWTDPYAYYIVKWQLVATENGKWNIISTLLETNHPYNKKDICKTQPAGTIQIIEPGKFKFTRKSMDSNPANAGYYEQTMTLTLSKAGTDKKEKLTGEGTHKGSKVTHWLKIEGERGNDNRCDKGNSGICDDPRILQIMDEWLSQAIPPQEPGQSFRYESWGRLVGQSRSANVTENIPPTTTLSRCEWLWEMAAGLQSTNLGTLKEYVEKKK
jgi:hypothetical protein